MRHKTGHMVFVHSFVVSPLERCSSGILGMDFLRQVGAEISLTDQLLHIGHYSFPLNGRVQGVSMVRSLRNSGPAGSSGLDREEGGNEPVENWEGTVELAGAVIVPPLSARIARCRVIRRDDSTVVKSPS
jgi:hypothetical protein